MDSFKSKDQVPENAEDRIKKLMSLPLSSKKSFVPEPGMRLNLGPFVFEVAVTNPSQLRFTAKLVDVIISGINDGKSNIIDPNTGKEFKKVSNENK